MFQRHFFDLPALHLHYLDISILNIILFPQYLIAAVGTTCANIKENEYTLKEQRPNVLYLMSVTIV